MKMQLGILADTKMLCRVCMVPVVEHPADLYDDEASPFGPPSLLVMLRAICAPVFAKPETEAIMPKMPTIVCQECRNAIVAAYNLHLQCIVTDRRLGELIALMWELRGDEIGEGSEDPLKSSIKEETISEETMSSDEAAAAQGHDRPAEDSEQVAVIKVEELDLDEFIIEEVAISGETLPGSVENKDQPAKKSRSQRGNAEDKTCVECGKTFSSRWTLIRHRREGWCDMTNDPMKRTCEICNKVLKTVQLLKRHRQMHDSTDGIEQAKSDEPGPALDLPEHAGDVIVEEIPVLNTEKVDLDETQSDAEEEFDEARGLRCTNCGISFSSNISYKNHMLERNCEGLQLFPCSTCGKVFDKFTRRQYHMRNHKERVTCTMCDQTFKNRDGLRLHHKRNRCPVARQGKTTTSKTVCQEDQNAKKTSKNHACMNCGKTFVTVWTLKRHKRDGWCDLTDDATKRTCTICNKVLKTVNLLRRHLRVHDGSTDGIEQAESDEPCPTLDLPELQASTQEHASAGDRPAEEFPVLDIEQVDVIKVEALDLMDEDEDVNEEAVNEVRGLKCINCGISFSSTISYRNHTLEGHCQGKQLFPCSICGKTFDTVTRLQYHVLNHKARVACPMCDLTFKNQNCLRLHQKRNRCSGIKIGTSQAELQEENTVKEQEQSEEQHQTQEEESDESLLVEKQTAKTNVEDDIQCANCGVTFSSKRAHQKHTQGGNCQQKITYPCKKCGMVFDRITRMHYHMYSHKERVTCPKCDQSFSNNSTLLRHLKKTRCKQKQTPEEGQQKPTYSCKVCGEIFYTYSRMLYHRRNHQKRVACPHCNQLFRNKGIMRAHIKSKRCLIGPANDSHTLQDSEPLEIINVEGLKLWTLEWHRNNTEKQNQEGKL